MAEAWDNLNQLTQTQLMAGVALAFCLGCLGLIYLVLRGR